MCGIAGIIGKKPNKQLYKNIKKILKEIKHRGPDGSGYFLDKDNNLALGNTRLSIQDISSNAAQPFHSKCKRFVIVFNGEIYNFKDLKRDLLEYDFKSNSDTEVLLYSYIKYGYNCLDKLKGFFAFAIWDKKNKTLFCARDKFGVKPFYYYKDENKFIFCSEIKPILNNKVNYLPNLNAINAYLTSEYYENVEHTFFKNIYKLNPGHILLYKNHKIYKKPYWDFRANLSKINLPKSIIEQKKYIYEKIDKAVKLSLVSDANVSIAASGGLDSSILFYHVKKNYGKISELVSFKFNDKNYSEEKYVNFAVKKFGYKAKYSLISEKNFYKSIKKSVEIQEEPFSGLPVIAYEKCFDSNNKYKVILDGSGLDEAHCGYNKYKFIKKDFSKFTQDGSYLGNIISNELEKKSNNYDYELNNYFKDPVKNLMYLDMFFIKIPRALRFRDKMSMAYSCELRPSYLDDELISILFNLEKKFHFNKKYGKLLLRNYYSNYIGKKIAFRNKQQIQTPQREWFKKDSEKYIENLLNKEKIWETNWIDKKKFENLFDLFKKNKINNSFFIWKAINLNEWYKRFF